MSLVKQINEDMKTALKIGDKEKRGTLQMLNAEIKNKAIELKVEADKMDDATTKEVILSFGKRLKDEIADLEKYDRDASKQQRQLAAVQSYLPTQLTHEQIDAAVDAAIQSTGATTLKEMGKVMTALKELREQADMKIVNELVKIKLS